MPQPPPTREELIQEGVLDPYRRKQTGLAIAQVYPDQEDGTCACGCGLELEGRRTRYATPECNHACARRFSILYGHTGTVRRMLYRREGGSPYGRDQARCQGCGRPLDYTGDWEAHHVLPVHQGGGACDLDGYALLCSTCHVLEHSGESHPAGSG